MLLYQYRVRSEIDQLKRTAVALRAKFGTGGTTEDLLHACEELAAQTAALQEMLPPGMAETHLSWRLGFIRQYLPQQSPAFFAQDLDDICTADIPCLERGFDEWCGAAEHYAPDFARAIDGHILHQDYRSTIRVALTLLQERAADPPVVTTEPHRPALDHLIADLSGIFRTCDEEDTNLQWYEVDAALSMANYVLKKLASLTPVSA